MSMMFRERTTITSTRFLFVLALGLTVLAPRAVLAERAWPEFSASECLDRVSGDKINLHSTDAVCPPGYTYYRRYNLKKVEAPPPSVEVRPQQQKAEARDAVADQE